MYALQTVFLDKKKYALHHQHALVNDNQVCLTTRFYGSVISNFEKTFHLL